MWKEFYNPQFGFINASLRAWGVETLMTQERALLYIILEVAVCIGDYPPPR